MKEYQVSASALARALGVSATSISILRKGKYRGDAKTLMQKIQLYIQHYKSNQNTHKNQETVSIFKSVDYKMAYCVMDMAVEEKEIAVITGEAGSGKTSIAKDYARTHPNAILIEATLGVNANILLNTLCERLKITPSKSIHSKIIAISDYLKKSDVVILIDEAEHLPLRALESLRRIWDFANCPMVLLGTEILIKNLSGKNGELKQLYSRICGIHRMKGLSESECSEFFNPFIFEFTLGNFRSSYKLNKMSLRLAGMHESKLCAEIVKEAVSMIIL